ncbi:hypothetical protein Pan14r_24380 [Crateriforma conspicua]|uniref:Uncharacterized protein n=1 Tax=Crateriforma conspicua TaxID=2527996 RepID=A0A5C5Y5D6_9PLAN|nr:hypothetical protein Mal65_39040 [Crateriforma conspicua]TWT70138.1 hypothetical protein Pan14r_24380 [Crateriforma conspicua]
MLVWPRKRPNYQAGIGLRVAKVRFARSIMKKVLRSVYTNHTASTVVSAPSGTADLKSILRRRIRFGQCRFTVGGGG